MNFKLVILLILAPVICLSQQKERDNREKVLAALKDTSKVDYLNELSQQCIEGMKKDTAQLYAVRAMNEAEKLHYIHGIAMSLSNQARILQHFDNEFHKSETMAKEAIRLLETTNDSRGLENAYDVLDFSLFSESKFDETYEILKRKYLVSKANKDSSGLYAALSDIGLIHYQQGNYDSAFLYMKQAQEVAAAAKNTEESNNILILFGELYRAVGDYKGAMDLYQQAFNTENPTIVQDRIDGDWQTWVEMEYAELFSLRGQFDSAWHYYGLLDTAKAAEKDLRIYLVSTGETYLLQANYNKALPNIERGLAMHRKLNDINEIKRTLLDLGRTYYHLQQNNLAIRYAREGIALAIQTKSNQFIRDGYEILYSTYERMHETDSAFYYYKLFNEKRNVVFNDQIKGRIAKYEYDLKIDKLSKEELINEQQLKLQQEKLRSESWTRNFLIACIGILLLLAIFILRNIALRNKNERLRNERAQSELQRKAVDLEMQALRSQMSPHFIFNCLNSINSFIIKNESQAASDYLTKFSRLIRMVLVNSKNQMISLDDELHMLKLYLDMERLRFKNFFRYEIVFEDAIDAENIWVPPMLMQPFAENAIWHGLLNKEKDGLLRITFSLERDSILLCRITDNGIGRQAAMEIRSKSAEDRKSMGLRITKERLDLMNENEDRKTYFEVEDLYDEGGRAAGTSVVLRIRIKDPYYRIQTN